MGLNDGCESIQRLWINGTCNAYKSNVQFEIVLINKQINIQVTTTKCVKAGSNVLAHYTIGDGTNCQCYIFGKHKCIGRSKK